MEPARARVQQPGHRACIEAAKLRAGLAVEADPRELIRLWGYWKDSSSALRRMMKLRISSFILVSASTQATLNRRCKSRGKSTVRRDMEGLTVSFPDPSLTNAAISLLVGCRLDLGLVRFFFMEFLNLLHDGCEFAGRDAVRGPLEDGFAHC